MKEIMKTAGDLENLKSRLSVGDIVAYERLTWVAGDRRLLVPVVRELRVKAKYPHLVELEGDGLPVRTLTYGEILAESLIRSRREGGKER